MILPKTISPWSQCLAMYNLNLKCLGFTSLRLPTCTLRVPIFEIGNQNIKQTRKNNMKYMNR